MLPEFSAEFLKTLLIGKRLPGRPEDGTYACTAVFLLTYVKKSIPYLLAVLKADNTGYPWRNQVALPGGHIDQNETPLDGAFRELEEEVGISRNAVEYIGSMGHFQTIANKDIQVFLGAWRKKQDRLKFDRQEISKILELPLPELLKIHISKGFIEREPGIEELIYPIQEFTIWGVTARIFHFFFELILSNECPSSANDLKGED